MLTAVRLKENYNGAKKGEVVELESAEDAQRWVNSGIAEYLNSPDTNTASKTDDEIVRIVYEQVKGELKTKVNRLFAEPLDRDKLSAGPYHNLGEFAKAVHTPDQKFHNWNQERSEKITGMGTTINADGGFLIPPGWSAELVTAISRESQVASRCKMIPVDNNIKLPFVKRGALALSSTGGMRVYKPAEGVAKTYSQTEFASAELRLHKMAIVVPVTDELLADSSIALQMVLETLAATEFALTKDDDVVQGSGAGECLGVVNAPCTISQAKETDQPADTIVTENVLKMYSRLVSGSAKNAVWLANNDTLPQLASLSMTVGTGGAPVGILQSIDNGGISNAPTLRLLGIPLILSPTCATIGTVGDLILGDFTQYVTITKQGVGMETATSIHLKFLEDETVFRFVLRFDGQPWWASAITPKRSAITQSPFITLATRT